MVMIYGISEKEYFMIYDLLLLLCITGGGFFFVCFQTMFRFILKTQTGLLHVYMA